MEDRIYHMFIYNDTVHSLWTALSQMYGHAHHDLRIFDLYWDIARASHETLGLSVADYFGFLQSRWEELEQYEPLSNFPAAIATIASPAPSYKPSLIFDQMAFAAFFGSGPRSSGVSAGFPASVAPFRSTSTIQHGGDVCLSPNITLTSVLHNLISNKIFGKGYKHDVLYYFGNPPCGNNILSTHIQLDDKAVRCVFLGYSTVSKGYCCYDTISQRLYHSLDVTFLEDAPFFAGTPSLSGSDIATIPAVSDGLSCLIPLFESPQVRIPPTPDAWSPPKVYTRRAQPLAPLPDSSSVASFPLPRSVFEALQNPQWVAAMQEQMDALERNGIWELVPLPLGAKPLLTLSLSLHNREALGEACTGDTAFADSLEAFGGGQDDPVSVSIGGPVLSKFLSAFRELATYKELLRSQHLEPWDDISSALCGMKKGAPLDFLCGYTSNSCQT
ncbi:ARF-GAP domain 2 [Actinidia rufa]|uniref:ARF-GAP domain 2 n=1 Tax=Actinidia rufa TaxID=165716 RepID=A0A7J0GYK1_9ERIC|nr:ARF-GAP domain 2 [Actinidia rufa]